MLKSEIGQLGASSLLLAIFLSEISRARIGWVEPETEIRSLREGYQPGDLGFDPMNFKAGFKSDEEFKSMQEKELRNGRLAMIAIAGMTVQELVTDQQLF